MLHTAELQRTFETMMHFTELRCTLLSYAVATQLRWTLLSYAASYWATLHPTEHRGTEPVALVSKPMLSYDNLQQKGDGLGLFNFVAKHHWKAFNFVTPL
jgi:hypothetical protein